MVNRQDVDEPDDVELFRRVMEARGPVLTESPTTFSRVVGAIGARYDGRLTNAVTRTTGAESPRWVWLHSDEVDVVLDARRPECDPGAVDQMPYPTEMVSPDDLVAAALRWPEVTSL